MKANFLLLFFLIQAVLKAQTLIFSDAFFKAKLLQSSTETLIAKNLTNDYFAIDANNNGEIELDEAIQVRFLNLEAANIQSVSEIQNFINLVSFNCSSNNISQLNISNLSKLIDLNCSNNLLQNLNLVGATSIENLDCQSNKLSQISISNVTNLKIFDCSNNNLEALDLTGFQNLQILNCNNNLISQISLQDLTALTQLNCSQNKLQQLVVDKPIEIVELNCSFNLISNLDASFLVNIENLDCKNNQLQTLNIVGLSQLTSLNCSYNKLTDLNLSSLFLLGFLNCNDNQLQNLTISGLQNLKLLECSNNLLTNLNTNGLAKLQFVYAKNNKLQTLDLSGQTELQLALVSKNNLSSLYLKNGVEESIVFTENPNLNYICADDFEIDILKNSALANGNSNCEVNKYCTLVPGGKYFTVIGNAKLDNNNDGCNANNRTFGMLKMNLIGDSATEILTPNSTGDYSHFVKQGNYTLTPVFENPSYYSVSPASYSINFAENTTDFVAPFCVNPIANKKDLELILLPLSKAKSGLESKYKIILKNKGTVAQSGNLSFNFDAFAMSFVVANPNLFSQNSGILTWNFSNLQPQETKVFVVSLKTNPTTANDFVLNFEASTSNIGDETALDNSKNLKQIVTNSTIFQDKICLEGNTISASKIGNYLHYLIRFENKTGSIAQNIVIKDLIDISKFDLSSVVSLDGSEPFVTKISGNNCLEFLFENCNLPSDEANNKGYVAFKIKTLSSLTLGDEIKNEASIYFEPNISSKTSVALTKIETLSTKNQKIENLIWIYPNPVKEVLTIENKTKASIGSFTIFNQLGQLILNDSKPINSTQNIDVSAFAKGIYFLKLSVNDKIVDLKFIKD